jgi:putative alpha-1,2-mannosidase
MKSFFRLMLPAAAISFATVAAAQKKTDNTPLVNVFIGTAGEGHTYPGAMVPFGMVQLGPDTRTDGAKGYDFADTVVYGFSHTHINGSYGYYGDILLMPTTGEPKLASADYSSGFKKKAESGSPGYYKTHLDKYNIDVELTATKRVGVHQYDYPKTDKANIIIDLQHGIAQVQDAWIEMISNHEVRGFRQSGDDVAGKQTVYFYAKFSRPFKTYGIALDDQVQQGKNRVQGKNVKMFLQFDNPGEVVTKVGLSSVSAEGALKNLDAEVPDFDFKKIRKDARTGWINELAKIQVEGGAAPPQQQSPYAQGAYGGGYNPYAGYPRKTGTKQVVVDIGKQKRTIFYTALYHSMLSPTIYNDVDGQYRGLDQNVHNANGFNYYTNLYLWDTYRNEHPLLTLIDKKRTLDFVKTLLAMYDDHNNLLPVAAVGGAATDYMGGNHAIPVIVDAYAKGIKDFNTDKALRAMKAAANRNDAGMEVYRKSGLVPAGKEAGSVLKTLDDAFDDWCIARFAKMLNKQPEYNEFIQRAQYWKNVFNNQSGFMQPRINGGWGAFDAAGANSTGDDEWQSAFAVPQDVETLQALMGGKEKFEAKLDELFTTPSKPADKSSDQVGAYVQSNAADQHVPYLYNFTDDPTKVQLYLSRIMKDAYNDTATGLSGDDAGGQLSAWYVMNALGIYPLAPGQQQFQIGLPQFDKATVTLENGKKFIITNTAVSQGNIYLQGMTLEKKPYSKLYLNYDDINSGGTFEYYPGRLPNRLFMQDLEKPSSKITDNLIVANPYFIAPSPNFKDNISLQMKDIDEAANIYYTLDGSAPSAGSKLYTGPVTISASTTVKAIAIKDGKQSFVNEGRFVKE